MMVLKLAQDINSQRDLRELASGGLRVRDYVVDRHLNNEPGDIPKAAYRVLQVCTQIQNFAHHRLYAETLKF